MADKGVSGTSPCCNLEAFSQPQQHVLERIWSRLEDDTKMNNSRHLLAISAFFSFLFATMSAPASSADRLPDGEVATFSANGKTYSAWYGSPTERYRHGILGDGIEAGSLHLTVGDKTYSASLPQDQVFEDRTPRLADLNGDGKPEIVTIRSYQDAGGSVAIFGVQNGALNELASSQPIGRSNRWLNIAGIADFAGTGRPQIAFVETPHIGGTLYFVEWRGDRLEGIGSLRGFSNHKIGSREQTLSATLDYDDHALPDLVVPSDNMRVLRVVGFHNGTLREIGRKQLPVPVLRHRPDAKAQNTCAAFELTALSLVQICGMGSSAR